MDEAKYFLQINGEIIGPISFGELEARSETLNDSVLVWWRGLEFWVDLIEARNTIVFSN